MASWVHHHPSRCVVGRLMVEFDGLSITPVCHVDTHRQLAPTNGGSSHCAAFGGGMVPSG